MSSQGEEIEHDEGEDTPEEEAQARRSGWRPLDEFTRKGGDPDQWRSAREFLDRGDKILPVVRAERDRLREQVERLEGDVGRLTTETGRLTNTIEEQRGVLHELREMARTASEAGYQRGMAELAVKRREAVEAGDVEAVDQISEQIEATKAARATVAKPRDASNPQSQPQAKIDPAVSAFVDANPWFMQDKPLHDAMNREHERLLQAHPAMAIGENLRRAKDAVMAQFPEKFGIVAEPEPDLEDEELEDEAPPAPAPRQRARSSAPLAPTSAGQRRRARATGIDSIEDSADRAQASAAFKRLKEQMPDFTEDEYMAIWRDPKADVLSVMKRKEASRG